MVKEKPTCVNCKKEFSTNYNLNKHIRRFHENFDIEYLDDTNVGSDELKKTQEELRQIKARLNRGKFPRGPLFIKTIQTQLKKGSWGISPSLNTVKKGGHGGNFPSLNELENRPQTVQQHQHNQILQVVCVGNNQNYLDMLTEQWD